MHIDKPPMCRLRPIMRSNLPQPFPFNRGAHSDFDPTAASIACFTENYVFAAFAIPVQDAGLAYAHHMASSECIVLPIIAQFCSIKKESTSYTLPNSFATFFVQNFFLNASDK